MKTRKILCVFLVVLLTLCLTMSVYAVPQLDTNLFVQNVLDYYRCYQMDAWREIQVWLKILDFADPDMGLAWRNIIDTWRWIDTDMEISMDVLPDGLPEDDSLAIVVMGFGLKPDGTMREELFDRLEVALNSARKYPNAYLICTGGATAANSNNTEAGEMAAWLIKQGVEEKRVIAETNSFSTIHNALYSYGMVLKDYPEIQSFAVVTSDYHIYRSVLYFAAVPEYYHGTQGSRVIPVVGSACCYAQGDVRESHNLLADGLAYMAGIRLDWQTKPALFLSK